MPQKGALWTEAFTGKLTDTVKLVGTTINCGGIVVDGLSRANPHVQTFAMATDAVSGTALQCMQILPCCSVAATDKGGWQHVLVCVEIFSAA